MMPRRFTFALAVAVLAGSALTMVAQAASPEEVQAARYELAAAQQSVEQASKNLQEARQLAVGIDVIRNVVGRRDPAARLGRAVRNAQLEDAQQRYLDAIQRLENARARLSTLGE